MYNECIQSVNFAQKSFTFFLNAYFRFQVVVWSLLAVVAGTVVIPGVETTQGSSQYVLYCHQGALLPPRALASCGGGLATGLQVELQVSSGSVTPTFAQPFPASTFSLHATSFHPPFVSQIPATGGLTNLRFFFCLITSHLVTLHPGSLGFHLSGHPGNCIVDARFQTWADPYS